MTKKVLYRWFGKRATGSSTSMGEVMMTFYDDWSVTLTVHFNEGLPSRPVREFLEYQGATYRYRSEGGPITQARVTAPDLGHAQAYAHALSQDTPSLSFEITACYDPGITITLAELERFNGG